MSSGMFCHKDPYIKKNVLSIFLGNQRAGYWYNEINKPEPTALISRGFALSPWRSLRLCAVCGWDPADRRCWPV